VWLPLSAVQQELWLAQELAANKESNCIAELFMIEGEVDEKNFIRFLHHVFREIETLSVLAG
jgi:hypothetical protein